MMGKFAAILGPILMGSFPRLAVILGIADERVAYSFGVGAIFLLFLIGGILLVASNRVKDERIV
jgi:MFS-type transporter involved in bile tolerance (Atg22 family)